MIGNSSWRRVRCAAVGGVLLAMTSAAPVLAEVSLTVLRTWNGNGPNIAGSSLDLVVRVTSSSAVSAVSAQLDVANADLRFDGTFWRGTLSLVDVPSGTHTLTVTATNTAGETATYETSLSYNLPPKVFVSSPEPWLVARNSRARVVASCVDREGPCVSLIARYNDEPNKVLATGTTALDLDVDLTAYEGTEGRIVVTGMDSSQLRGQAQVEISIDASASLRELVSVDGQILNLDGTRLLVLEPDRRSLALYTLASGQSQTIARDLPTDSTFGFHPFWASRMVDDGALFTLYNPLVFASPGAVLYQWWNDALLEVDRPESSVSLDAAGHYAIWSVGKRLFRRDLETSTNTLVTDNAGNTNNAVASDGSVWFWSGAVGRSNIFVYRDDGIVQLTNDDEQVNVYPVTDGREVVYGKWTPAHPDAGTSASGPPYRIAINGPDGEEIIDGPEVEHQPVPGADYQINAGWVAYTSGHTGPARQVFVRSPMGVVEKVTSFDADSTIDALDAHGNVFVLNAGTRYLALRGRAPQRVSSAIGKGVAVGSDWRIAIGRSLFCPILDLDAGMSACFSTARPQDAGPDDAGTTDGDAASADSGAVTSSDAGASRPDAAPDEEGDASGPSRDAGLPDAATRHEHEHGCQAAPVGTRSATAHGGPAHAFFGLLAAALVRSSRRRRTER